jgi:hypothetical protein
MTAWPADDKAQPPGESAGDLPIPPLASTRHFVASAL